MYINCCCCKICIWCWRKKSRKQLEKERKERIQEIKRLHEERKRLIKLLREKEKRQK